MKTLNVTKSIISVLLVLVTNHALADRAGGGGHRMNEKFFDQWLKEKLFRPESDTAFNQLVEPQLALIESWVPVFAGDMKAVLKDKEWYQAKPRQRIHPLNAGILFDANEAAYQTDEEIFIDDEWLKIASDEGRATAYIHEMIQGIRMKDKYKNRADKSYDIAPEQVWRLTIRLLSNKYKKASDIKKDLDNMGFYGYETLEQIQQGDAETLEIRNLIASYQERLVEICKKSRETDFLLGGNGTKALRIIGRDVLSRIGYISREELVQAGEPNLDQGKGQNYKRELEKMFNINFLNSHRPISDIRELFDTNNAYEDFKMHDRIKICNRVGVQVPR